MELNVDITYYVTVTRSANEYLYCYSSALWHILVSSVVEVLSGIQP